MNKTALVITIALTAFILVISAGVFFGVRTAQAVLASSDPAPAATEVAVPANEPVGQQIQQAVAQRDASYKDLIDQANARIDTLQKENQALKEQLSAAQNNAQAQNSAQSSLTPQEAAQVAAFWVGDNQIYSVDNVTIRNIPLYKVNFSSGLMVYVSLDGQVVGSQLPAASGQPLRQGSSESGERDGDGD